MTTLKGLAAILATTMIASLGHAATVTCAASNGFGPQVVFGSDAKGEVSLVAVSGLKISGYEVTVDVNKYSCSRVGELKMWACGEQGATKGSRISFQLDATMTDVKMSGLVSLPRAGKKTGNIPLLCNQ